MVWLAAMVVRRGEAWLWGLEEEGGFERACGGEKRAKGEVMEF